MKSLPYETRAMLRALDRYWRLCEEGWTGGEDYKRALHHDDDYAYWELYELRRARVEALLKEGER